jgi:hypothetical protein
MWEYILLGLIIMTLAITCFYQRRRIVHTGFENLKLTIRNNNLSKITDSPYISGIDPYAVSSEIANAPKEVCQYDLTGCLIKKFRSLREAERGTGISRHRINKACKSKDRELGFYFAYGNHENIIITNIKKK